MMGRSRCPRIAWTPTPCQRMRRIMSTLGRRLTRVGAAGRARDGADHPRRRVHAPPRGSAHSVRTATLLEPRVTAPSLNRTKTRLSAGLKFTVPVAVTKTLNVGCCPAPIVVVTLGAGGARHWPAVVWHSVMVRGRDAEPVSAETVSVPLAPLLLVATTNALMLVDLGMSRINPGVGVSASAMISGTGVGEAD